MPPDWGVGVGVSGSMVLSCWLGLKHECPFEHPTWGCFSTQHLLFWQHPKVLPSGQSIITSEIPGWLGFPIQACVISVTCLLWVQCAEEALSPSSPAPATAVPGEAVLPWPDSLVKEHLMWHFFKIRISTPSSKILPRWVYLCTASYPDSISVATLTGHLSPSVSEQWGKELLNFLIQHLVQIFAISQISIPFV